MWLLAVSSSCRRMATSYAWRWSWMVGATGLDLLASTMDRTFHRRQRATFNRSGSTGRAGRFGGTAPRVGRSRIRTAARAGTRIRRSRSARLWRLTGSSAVAPHEARPRACCRGEALGLRHRGLRPAALLGSAQVRRGDARGRHHSGGEAVGGRSGSRALRVDQRGGRKRCE